MINGLAMMTLMNVDTFLIDSRKVAPGVVGVWSCSYAPGIALLALEGSFEFVLWYPCSLNVDWNQLPSAIMNIQWSLFSFKLTERTLLCRTILGWNSEVRCVFVKCGEIVLHYSTLYTVYSLSHFNFLLNHLYSSSLIGTLCCFLWHSPLAVTRADQPSPHIVKLQSSQSHLEGRGHNGSL